jgi:hypothetical protein
LPENVHTNVSGVNGSVAEAVAGGGVFYTLRVTTANNCWDTERFIISENLNVPEITLTTTDNGICDPALATSTYNGTVTADVTFDGVTVTDFTNYAITWHEGSLDTDPVINGETSTLLDERNGGFYTVVIERTDLSCTSAPVTAEVINATVLPTIETDSIPSTNCAGGAPNGGVTVTSITPADTYTYRWFDPANALIAGETASSISGYQGGSGQNYTVEVTLTSTGCSNTLATVIPDNKLNPVLALTPSDNSICDGALGYNGTITGSFTDTNALAGHGYTYLWSTGNDLTNPIAGETSSSLTEQNGGFYTATITNTTLNCTSSPVTTEILNNQILPAISSAPDPSTNCPGGDPNGKIDASVTNNTTGATMIFQWYSGNTVDVSQAIAASPNQGNSANAIQLQGGQDYLVHVRNQATGCENTFIQSLADNSVVPVLALDSIDNSICDAGLTYNGSAFEQSIAGVNELGTDTYTFEWSTGSDMSAVIAGETSSTLADINGGFYTATAINDRLNCTSNPVTIEVKNILVLPAISSTPTPSTNCAGGDPNGQIDVTVTNNPGADPMAFKWYLGNVVDNTQAIAVNPNQGESANVILLQGGLNYTVHVRNLNTGCENTFIQTLADNSVVPVLALDSTNNSICDATLTYNGSALQQSVTGTNELLTDTYTFAWSTGSDMSGIIPTETTNVLDEINGGFYTATATNDRLNCTSNPVTIEVKNILVLPAISATPTPSTNCAGGDPNGEIDVTVTNNPGADPMAFKWYLGNVVDNTQAIAVSPNQGESANVILLQGGLNYTVHVRNLNTGCENTFIQTLADNSVVPVLALDSTNNSICDATLTYNGSALQQSVTGTNELLTDTYTFAWSTGSDMSGIIPTETTNVLDEINGGFYTATATNDRLNCTSNPVTIEVKNILVLPAISATPTPSTNCAGGDPNGEIDVTVTNNPGADPMAFKWYLGNVVDITQAIAVTPNQGESANVILLQGGLNYTVHVRNEDTGCESTFTQALADVSALPTFDLTIVNNQKCVSPFDGSLTITGLTDTNSPAADTYTVNWYDGSVVTPGSEDQINNNVAEGSLGASSARTALDNGFYTVIITNDRLNCTSNPVTREVLDNLTLPTITLTPTPSTNCAGGTDNGEVDALVTGLAGQTFNYAWFKGTTTADPGIGANAPSITGQQGGQNYTLEATAIETGCANTATAFIQDDSQIPVVTPLLFTNNTNCTAPFNGTARVDTTTPFTYRGTTIDDPYTGFTFTWSAGGAVNALGDGKTELGAGTYSLYVTAGATNTVTSNNDNCVSTPVSVTVSDVLTYPVIEITKINQTSCNTSAPNGQLTSTVGGATAGHDFQWFEGIGSTAPAVDITDAATTNFVRDLASGDYTTLVTNSTTRCTSSLTIFLPDSIVNPVISFSAISDVTSCLPPNGSATPLITGVSPAPNTDFTIYYVKTFSIPSDPASPPSDPAVIEASSDTYSSTAAIAVGTNPPIVNNLQPGYLTGLVIDNYTTCESSPATVQIEDQTVLNDINVGAIAAAGLCGGGGGGSIDVTVSGGTGAGTYTYAWYEGTPSNSDINFFNNPPDMTASLPQIASTEDLLEDLNNPPAGLDAGTYTLVVTDGVGCGNYSISSVPFADRPDITITETNPERCTAPFDGDLAVTLTNANFGPYSIVFYEGNSPDPTNIIKGEICDDFADNDNDGLTDLFDPDCGSLVLNASMLTSGQYLVRVIDYTLVNRDCPLDNGVTLNQDAFAPIVQINNIQPNTACDDTNFADGAVEITISKDGNDPRAAADLEFEITSVTPVPINMPGSPDTFSGVATVTTTLNYGFAPDTYIMRVTETASGCFADQSIAIPDQPSIPKLLEIAVTNESFCAPNSDGRAVVSSVSPVAIADYHYRWHTAPDLSGVPIWAEDGGVNRGEILDLTNYANWVNPTPGLGIGTREYYVRGERLPGTGPGAGCPTPAVKVVVQDEHVTPMTTLSSLANTSCTPGTGEGRIFVTTETNSTDGAVQAATYTYSIPVGPNTVAATNGHAGTPAFVYNALEEGTYTVSAVNEVSGCATTGDVTIAPTKFTLEITDKIFNHQLICDPNGDIEVTEIEIDRSVTGEALLSYNASLTDDFDFEWFRAPVATPGTFDPSAALEDVAGPTEINREILEAGTGVGQYPGMGAGTYYVVATRKGGAGATAPVVGLGCETAPLRVDIFDQHVNPVITLTPFSNTACNMDFEGEIDVDIADNSDASFGPFGFDYTWTTSTTSPPAPVANPYSIDPVAADANFSGLEEGNYTLQAKNNQTGCVATSTTTIFKNTIPIFVTKLDITPQFYCDPSGKIIVTEINYEDRNGIVQNAPVTDFVYSWSLNNVVVATTDPASPVDASHIGTELDSISYAGIGAGVYQLVAQRSQNGPGAGCETAPINIDIADKREFPVITLTPFSNTSCTTDFEGEIEVDVSDQSVAKVPPVADNYNYTWSAISVAGGLPANLTTGLTNPYDGIDNVFTQLEDGAYQLTAVNNVTGCSSIAQTSIVKNQTPVFVQDVDMIPQFYCERSGNIEVMSISYNDRDGVSQPGPLVDFIYQWTRNDLTTLVANTDGASARGTILDSLSYAGAGTIGAGTYYVIATRDDGVPGAGCSSAPFRIEIADKREFPVITLSPFSNTSCTADFEGEIEVDVSDQSVAKVPPVADNYNYTWSAISVASGLPASLTTGLINPYDGIDNVFTQLEDGVYQLTAVNNVTGCSSIAQTSIVKNQTPVFVQDVEMIPQFYCEPSGNIEVMSISYNDRDGVSQPGPLVDFIYQWTRNDLTTLVANTDGAVARGTILDSLSYAGAGTIGAGTYYVVATRDDGVPGAGCSSAPFRTEIADKREFPVITLSPFSNTSCTADFEGEIEVDVSDQSVAKVPPVADNYNYTWSAISVASGLPASLTTGLINPYDGIDNVFTQLEDGVYQLTAVNNVTGCSSSAHTSIIKNQTPVFIPEIDMVPQFYCDPSGNIEVMAISYTDRDGVFQPGSLPDFTFEWTRNDLSTVVGNTDGSTARGTILDSLSYAGAGTIGAGTYYVVATRDDGFPGAGCSSAPYKIEIADERENPVVNFTTLANTACDDKFDGRITVLSSNSKAPGAGANYDIQWISVPAGNILASASGAGSSYTTPLTDIIGPGSFTVRATNETTNCFSDAVVSMISNPYPVEILTVSKTNQMICFPDGSITVSAVSPAVVPEYSFNWFRNDAASPALEDASPATITASTLDNTNYPSMGADTYFIVGQKNTTLGSGCLTPPFRVNIEDRHVDPNLSFTFAPNSSCDVTNPNGQIVATASERDGTTDNYTFDWTLNDAALPGVTGQIDNTPVSQLDNAYEGKYALLVINTVTGCDYTSGITVNLDHNVSLPNVITVDTFDPLDCLGSGSAEVTAISIGGGPAITGPVLGTDFAFEWYADDFNPASQLPNMDPLLPNVNAGRYFVRVQDLTTDCKSSPTEMVILDDDIVYPVVTIEQTALQVRCVTDEGTAQLIGRGDGNTDADPDYQFSWFRNLDASGSSFSSTSTVSDLLHGEYSVLVTNSATGCSASKFYVVRDDSDRYMPQLSLNTEARVNCLVLDGALLAREVGYDPNSGYPYPSISYTTELYTDPSADVSQPGIVMNYLSGFNRNWYAGNLDVGPFIVKITDNNTGCFVTGVNAVADQRTAPVLTIIEDSPLINCDPARPNGQLSATADGGRVGGYAFEWYSGTTASGAILTYNNKLIGVGMGDYAVRVTNNITYCSADGTASITDGRLLPPTPTAVLVYDRTRCDYPDGWVAANVSGITLNYTFDWYDGAAVKNTPDFSGVNYQRRDIGFYTVTAMDQTTGCISLPESLEVKDLRVIPEVIIYTTPSYCEELPGSVGGTGTAEVQLVPADVVSDEVTWSLQPDMATIGIGNYITNVLPGFYQADVTTSTGCQATGVGQVKTEVYPYNLVSSNGDRKNDDFRIDCITDYPNNNVKIFNRAGVLVYEADGYDNNDVVFTGIGEKGVYTIGNELPVGTYFYIIDKRDGSKPKTGYLELVK